MDEVLKKTIKQANNELDTPMSDLAMRLWIEGMLDSLNETENEMPTRDELDNLADALGEPLMLMDGFDEAVIGTSQRPSEPMLVVYDWNKMVETLIERDGMEYEDAVEYISYNCTNAWFGERTPIIVIPLDEY